MENYGTASNNKGLYFSNLMSELGAQGIDMKGREPSPDSELNLEEDYESENEEPLKYNTSCSSNIFSALNSEVKKLGCTGVPEKSCSCSFCVKAAYMWADLHYQDTRGRLSGISYRSGVRAMGSDPNLSDARLVPSDSLHDSYALLQYTYGSSAHES